MQRGEGEPAWKRCSLGRNNTLNVVDFSACVKEEMASWQVLSHINQNGCLTGGKDWIQTAENLMGIYHQSFYPVRSVRRKYSALNISLG